MSWHFALSVLDGNVMGKSCVFYFMRAETPHANVHELDAHMNFLIHGI